VTPADISAKRARMLASMADHVLAHGVRASSLRPLAAAAGTSDRMLVYHFGSREALLAEVLQRIAADFAARFGARLAAAGVKDAADLLTETRAALRDPAIAPPLRVWLELLALPDAARAPFEPVLGAIADGMADLVRRHEPDPARAALVFALVEGLVVLDRAGRPGIADRALEGYLRDRPGK